MLDKFKNKYRIKSARLPNWDYGSNGMYFITICTQNREHFFGDIIDGKMQLNEIGELAQKYWNEIPQHFPFVKLGEFVVMPNHTHGILIINKMDDDISVTTTTTVETLRCNASTPNAMSSPNPISSSKNQKMANISPKPGSISTIIRSYKSVLTKNARLINPDFGWQSRFHDHIIRNDKSYQNISNYIINNPINWNEDKFCKKEN